jgi:hypothetical protein
MNYELAMNMNNKHVNFIIVSTTISFWNILTTNTKYFVYMTKYFHLHQWNILVAETILS